MNNSILKYFIKVDVDLPVLVAGTRLHFVQVYILLVEIRVELVHIYSGFLLGLRALVSSLTNVCQSLKHLEIRKLSILF